VPDVTLTVAPLARSSCAIPFFDAAASACNNRDLALHPAVAAFVCIPALLGRTDRRDRSAWRRSDRPLFAARRGGRRRPGSCGWRERRLAATASFACRRFGLLLAPSSLLPFSSC
jgi:hypothetical protein